MAKNKPLRVNPGIKGNVGLSVANALIDLTALIAANKQIFYCGKPECGATIIFDQVGKRPVVCKKCGEGIDWVNTFTSLIKECPQCYKEYKVDDNYCPDHEPAVKLNEKEVERT